VQFLVLWLVAFVALMLTLRLLSWVYTAFDGDLGLTGWKRETVIAAITGLLQAVFFWLSVTATGTIVSRILPAAGVVLFLCFKITHLSNSVLEGNYEMENAAITAIAVTQIAVLILGSLALTAYLG